MLDIDKLNEAIESSKQFVLNIFNQDIITINDYVDTILYDLDARKKIINDLNSQELIIYDDYK